MPERPLCFVIMPFGLKPDPGGGPEIDFDRIYRSAIAPGIEAAGLQPVRADEERVGGIIHKPMFERLLLCDYALVDLTTGNPNVFYEVGVRHAVRPSTTLAIFARGQQIPFDVNYVRALPYDLGERHNFGDDQAAALRQAIGERLQQLRQDAAGAAAVDSPLFQLLNDYQPPDIARLKTDVFRQRVAYASELKQRLAEARERRDVDALHTLEAGLGPVDSVEAGVFVDLFLSYRAVKSWQSMVDLYQRLPLELQRSAMLREQLGFAYNRLEQRDQALRVLQQLREEQGPSSETCGLIGRVYKDLWQQAVQAGEKLKGRGFLARAIEAYVEGFESDWRDAYPGINALTLLEIRGDEGSLQQKRRLLPVVRFAVTQRLRACEPDYWDHATLLELAVLEESEVEAYDQLTLALSRVREPWEPETTANNLALIRDARAGRGVQQPWLTEILQELESAAKS
ncbi:MAG: DUF4071 domain-containing protein [Gammaproteobacteria bacterium]|nr:DUF4071 domain-containing protein [Gammaproteobacteria bacterium]